MESIEENSMKKNKIESSYGECPICLNEESVRGKYCHGCDHEFCYECISSWVLNFARCPMCNGLIYGLHSQDSSIYLTPHWNTFGMDIKKSTYGDRAEIDKILNHGIASQYKLKPGYFVMINGKSSFIDCLKEMKNAMRKKCMIKVNVIPPPVKRTESCFDFIFRCRISQK